MTEIEQSSGLLGPPPDHVFIALRDIHKSFGDNYVLRGISINVERGTSVVVMGGSGSGKSVLIKHIVRLIRPDRGAVWVKGQCVNDLGDEAMDALRLSIGYLFQGGALFDSMNVFENIDFLLRRHSDMEPAERARRVVETLAWVNLPDVGPKYPAELSGGQRKRVALARAIVLEPAILLYDEPTTGLDPASVRTVAQLIVRLREERGITSVTITHDLLCAEMIADSAHFLHEGRIAESGSFHTLRNSNHTTLRNFFGV